MPSLHDYIDDAALTALIAAARREDLGPLGLDATSALFVSADATCEVRVVARQAGVVAGLALLPSILAAFGQEIALLDGWDDGASVAPGDVVATLRGPTRSVLTAERVMLNFLGHLSGVATHTAAYVTEVRHTRAKVYDTRKTLPGLRGVQKYAVACGGGHTHRMGLYDAVLVKDNHLAGVPMDQLTPRLREMSQRARREVPGLKFVMVEVDTLDQFDRVLPGGVDLILLDNMTPDQLREAVTRRDAFARSYDRRVELEASGGVNLHTVRVIAESGVDRISVGALTHSSVNLDLGLDAA